MKLHLLPLLGLSLAAALGVRAETYAFKEPFEKSGTFNATGSVELHNVNGNVEIRAWDKNEIKISGEKSAATEEELKAIEMTIEQTPDRAEVTVKLPKRDGWFGTNIRASVRFTIMVPAGAKLDQIATVNGGVDVVGMRGGMRVESVNGRVKAVDIAGTARLSTVNGGVDATFASLPQGSNVHVKSTNGGVSVALPHDVSATFDLETVNGGLSCDFPIEVSGHIVGRSAHGKVGDGASTINLRTVNGGVHVRKA